MQTLVESFVQLSGIGKFESRIETCHVFQSEAADNQDDECFNLHENEIDPQLTKKIIRLIAKFCNSSSP